MKCVKWFECVFYIIAGVIVGSLTSNVWCKEQKEIKTVAIEVKDTIKTSDRTQEKEVVVKKTEETKPPLFFESFVIEAEIRLKSPKENEYAIKQSKELKNIIMMLGDVKSVDISKIQGKQDNKLYEIKECR